MADRIRVCMYDNRTLVETDKSTLASFQKEYASIHGYISVIICILGIFLNAANIIVLTRRNMVTCFNVILTWLAVADNLKMLDYLIFAIEFYILREPELDILNTYSHSNAAYLLFHASFAIVCHNTAVWLTVSLALFRFLYIWFPGKGSALCTVRRAKITVALVYILVALFCIPNYESNFLDEKPPLNSSAANASCRMTYTVNMINPMDPMFVVNTYIQAILAKIVPCVLLTVLTFLLIYAMHQAYQKRKLLKSQGKDQDARRHHEHNRTTGMLLAVVILFLLVELPFGILTLMVIFIKGEFQAEVYDNLADFHELLALCNNAVNFLLYCSMSKQFRETFISIFCTCIPEQRYRVISTAMTNRSNIKHNDNINTAMTNMSNINHNDNIDGQLTEHIV